MRKFPDWLLFLIGYCSLYTQQWTTANRENLWKARSLNLLLLSSSRSSTPTFVLCNSNSSPSVEQWGIPVGLHCVCMCGYQMCTMLVSYMSRVEAFVTGIKIESSDQTLFESRSRDQGYLRTVKSKNQLQFDLWPIKIKLPRAFEGMIKHTFCRSKILITVANASTGDIQVTTPCWFRIRGL